MAVMLLWLLDASNNTAMEPYRAFIADKLPPSQLGKGFLAQSFFTGLGITLANISLFVFQKFIAGATEAGIPYWVVGSFMLGAVCSIGTVLVSVLTTPEIPPTDEELAALRAKKGGLGPAVKEIGEAIRRHAAAAAQAGAGLPVPVVRHGLLLAVRRAVHRQVGRSRTTPEGKEEAVGVDRPGQRLVQHRHVQRRVLAGRLRPQRGAKLVHCVCLLLRRRRAGRSSRRSPTSTCCSSRSSASASPGPRSWACPTSWRSG